MKRKAPKARKTSRGTSSKSAAHRQTGYYKALTDPINGPLVGVPQFVPIETHRVRARAIGTMTTGTEGEARICFNPCRMVANDSYPVLMWKNQGGAAIDQAKAREPDLISNVPYSSLDFQSTNSQTPSTINNGDGIKARVVGAMLRVCNVSAVQTRGGVFTALHEPHHKTVDTFTRSELAGNSKSIIKPAGDGSYVSLLYRPVKPEEVEDWQINAFVVPGNVHAYSTSIAGDGTTLDDYPGYMVVDFKGEGNTTLHVEAYAIIEYAGESLTTLSRPIHLGGGKKADPKDMPAIGTDLKKLEGMLAIASPEQVAKSLEIKLSAVVGMSGRVAQQIAEADVPVIVRMPLRDHQAAAYIAALKGGQNAGGGLEGEMVVSDALKAAPSYLDMGKARPLFSTNDGRTVAFFDPQLNKPILAIGGTHPTNASQVSSDWLVNPNTGEVGTNLSIMNGTFDQSSVHINNEKAFEKLRDMEIGTPEVYGHSQGGTSAMIIGEKYETAGVVAFNPAITKPLLPMHPSGGDLTVIRSHTDPIPGIGTVFAKDTAPEGVKVVNVGLKSGTTSGFGHELSQFTHADTDVMLVTPLTHGVKRNAELMVETERMGQKASKLHVAGKALGVAGIAVESVYDAAKYDGDIPDKLAVGAADVAVGGMEWAAIAGAAAVGGPVGAGVAIVADMFVHSALKEEAQAAAVAVERGLKRGIEDVYNVEQRAAKRVKGWLKHFF
jgi:hypothetical protein